MLPDVMGTGALLGETQLVIVTWKERGVWGVRTLII